jgi:hypothetical protein
MTPSGMRGVLNDAVSIYFLDATLASAFVARWCAGSRIETDGGVFRIRDDESGAAHRGRAAPDTLNPGKIELPIAPGLGLDPAGRLMQKF